MEQSPLPARGRDDAGFTLIEVIIALALVGLVSTAAMVMATRGVESGVRVQDTQTATTLANQAMEQARAVSASVPAGESVTGLVQGRTQAAVQAQWAAASNPAEAETRITWDPTVLSGDPVALPLSTTSDVDRQTYTVNTLVGTCYRQRGSATDPCRYTGTVPPADTHTAMARVMVEVTWTPTGSSACPAGGCAYRVTSLVDAQGDRTWVAGAGLKAIDDPATPITAKQEVVINVRANDIGQAASSNAVEVVTPPAAGQVVSIDPTTGAIRYRAPGGGNQVLDFTYRFRNTTGSWSNAARVTVSVSPAAVQAVADAPATVGRGVTSTLVVLTNDTFDGDAAVPSLTLTQPPAGRGSVTAGAGGTVTYTSPTTWPTSGRDTTTFTYRFTDAYGQVSNSATVTVTVRVPPVAASFTLADVSAQAASATTTVDVDVLARATGTEGSATIELLSQPASGGTVGTATRSGRPVFTYRPPATLGKFSFTYRVLQDGVPSAPATMSLRVLPRPVDDGYNGAVRNQSYNFSPSTNNFTINDLPSDYNNAVELRTVTATCGTVSAITGSSFQWRAPSTTGTCVLTYGIRGRGANTDLAGSATITLGVTS